MHPIDNENELFPRVCVDVSIGTSGWMWVCVGVWLYICLSSPFLPVPIRDWFSERRLLFTNPMLRGLEVQTKSTNHLQTNLNQFQAAKCRSSLFHKSSRVSCCGARPKMSHKNQSCWIQTVTVTKHTLLTLLLTLLHWIDILLNSITGLEKIKNSCKPHRHLKCGHCVGWIIKNSPGFLEFIS